MKRILSMLLAAALMLFLSNPVLADSHFSERESVKSVDPSSTYMKQRDPKAMPSIGSVKLPVILVDFDGYRMDESFREKCETYFNAEYDPLLSEESPFAQSVRGAYKKLSYGRLDLTVDVLPIFHSEYSAFHYKSRSEGYDLVIDILKTYVESGLLRKEDYDSDHDGLVDGVIAKFYLTPEYDSEGNSANQGDAFGDHTSNIASLDGFSRCTFTTMFERYPWSDEPLDIWDADQRNTDAHEIGHMMGLPDHYPTSSYTWLDYQLGDIMTAGCMQYINVYDKLLLGWVDPVILTNDDAVSKQDLYAVEDYSEQGSPKALVFIPDPLMFPNTEFYMAEYRNASQRAISPHIDQMYGHPGIVIWHCRANLTSSNQHLYSNDYIRPVYKSGKVKDENNWYQSIFDSSDLYATGDIFSADTTPNSDLYDDIYTGAYLEVESITPEKAVIKAGFRNPDLTPPPTLEFPELSRRATQKGTTVSLGRLFIKSGVEVIPAADIEEFPYQSYEMVVTGEAAGLFSYTLNDIFEFENPMWINFIVPPKSGEGTLRVKFKDGAITYKGKASRETLSPVIYVDNTPPEIILNGENPQHVELGGEYVEPGAQASDNLDAKIENNVQLSIDNSQVNTQKLGTYSVTYSAKDVARNKTEMKRTVIVEDTIAPTAIVTYSTTQPTNGDVAATLVPSEEVTVTNNDGSLTHTFTANGSFTFEFEDEAGNKGTAVATVANIDKSLPTGTVSYDIPGLTNQDVTATLAVDPGITILNNDGKNTHVFTENGSFEFQIRNAVGTEGVVAAAVNWIDKEAPTATVEYSTTTATNRDVVATIDPSEEVTVTSEGGESHTFAENGSFTFTFTDKAGNTGSATATVNWIDKEAPVIVLNGDNPQTIQKGGSYVELGAAVTDNMDEEIGSRLVIDSSNVDTLTAGEYTVTYNAADEAGNEAETKTRIVKVEEPAPDPPSPPDLPEPDDPSNCLKDGTCPFARFSDADLTAWYHDGVHYCIENGLMNGYGNGKFCPNNSLTRGMVAQILYNKEGRPAVTGESPFVDVAGSAWHAVAVTWAAENDIVGGYGNKKYGPEDPVTREQLATILWRYDGSPECAGKLDSFTDGNKASEYAIPALQWAVDKEIIRGRSNGTLDPGGKATRAEVAAVLMRFCDKRA